MADTKENPHLGHREKLRQRFIHENGFETVQDWLESTVRVILRLRRKEAADETDPR